MGDLSTGTNKIEYDYTSALRFHSQWYCYKDSYMQHFLLTYFPYDGSLELYDTDHNKLYLSRKSSESYPPRSFFVGNIICVYGRHVELIACADTFTHKIISVEKEHTFALVKPTMIRQIGLIINELQNNGFTIFKMQMVKLNRNQALKFYETRIGDVFLPFLIEHIISGRVLGMEVVGYNALERWLELIGPEDPVIARKTHPTSLRARFGQSRAENAFHGSDHHEAAAKESKFFFKKSARKLPLAPTIKINNTTCCVVKPHVIVDGRLGDLISTIERHPLFEISAMNMIHFTTADCEEFLEVYKGCLADFHSLLLTYLNGPSIGLEISSKYDGINVFEEFRKFAGPVKPMIARNMNTTTLRAMFGIDNEYNALHVAELPGDTSLELQYIFKIIE